MNLVARRRMLCCTLLILACGSVFAREWKDAQELIDAVRTAAEKRDFIALKKTMSVDFVSSFGGNGGIDEAISLWRADKLYLREMLRATDSRCAWPTKHVIECPRNAGTNYRATFQSDGKTWRFTAFVIGD